MELKLKTRQPLTNIPQHKINAGGLLGVYCLQTQTKPLSLEEALRMTIEEVGLEENDEEQSRKEMTIKFIQK
jgi:hypothetical protein